MTLRNTLNRLLKALIEEAERSPEFGATLSDILGLSPKNNRRQSQKSSATEPADSVKRGKNRRPPAILDPIQVVRDKGEAILQAELEKLSLDQLRDIVAEYGMNSNGLVMRWKTPARVINRIVELATTRAHKGDAFRKSADNP